MKDPITRGSRAGFAVTGHGERPKAMSSSQSGQTRQQGRPAKATKREGGLSFYLENAKGKP